MEDLSNYFTISSVLNGFCDNSLTTFRLKMVLKDKTWQVLIQGLQWYGWIWLIRLDQQHQLLKKCQQCYSTTDNSERLSKIWNSLPGVGRVWFMQSDFSYQRTNGIAFGRNNSPRYNVILYTRNIESFTLCPVYNGICITMSSRILDLGSNGGSLGGKELISNLLPIDPIREGALTWASALKSQFVVPSAVIFFFSFQNTAPKSVSFIFQSVVFQAAGETVRKLTTTQESLTVSSSSREYWP